MVVPIPEEVGIGSIAHVLHQLVHDGRFRGPFDADLLLDAAVYDAEVSGVGDDAQLGLLVDADHPCSCFGGGFKCRKTGNAESDHQDVTVLLLFDVGGHLGRCQKSGLGCRCLRCALRVRLGCLAAGSRCCWRAACQPDARSNGGRCSPTQECAAAYFVGSHVVLLSLIPRFCDCSRIHPRANRLKAPPPERTMHGAKAENALSETGKNGKPACSSVMRSRMCGMVLLWERGRFGDFSLQRRHASG